jgi:hypothetical protein
VTYHGEIVHQAIAAALSDNAKAAP